MTRYAIQLADFMHLRQHDPALGIVLAANAERASVMIGKERFDERDVVRIWRNDTGAKSAWKRV